MTADRRTDIARLVTVVIGTVLFTSCLVILVMTNLEYGTRSALMLTGALGASLVFGIFRDVGRSDSTSHTPERTPQATTTFGRWIQRYW
jgi:hypothetical protein